MTDEGDVVSKERCPSDWALEQYLLAERDIDPDVIRHITSCARCRELVEHKKRLGNEYMASDASKRLRGLLKQGVAVEAARPKRRLSGWGFALVLATLSVASVLPFLLPQRSEDAVAELDLSAKGVGRIVLWIDGPDGPVPLDTDVVRPNTRLQCGLLASETGFVAGFVEDGEQLVRLFPEQSQASAFSSRVPAALGPSFRVDENTQSITVMVYFSKHPFDVTGLEVSLRAGGGAPFEGAVFTRKVDVRER